MIFIFSMIADVQCSVHFLLHSKVTPSLLHVYILFSHIIMLHHECNIRALFRKMKVKRKQLKVVSPEEQRTVAFSL